MLEARDSFPRLKECNSKFWVPVRQQHHRWDSSLSYRSTSHLQINSVSASSDNLLEHKTT